MTDNRKSTDVLSAGREAVIDVHQVIAAQAVVEGEVVHVSRPYPIPTVPTPNRYLPPPRFVRQCDLPGARRGLLRRAVDDPFWILLGLISTVSLGILGTLTYGVLVTLARYGLIPTVIAVVGVICGVLCLVAKIRSTGRGSSHRCAGLHCSGCRA